VDGQRLGAIVLIERFRSGQSGEGNVNGRGGVSVLSFRMRQAVKPYMIGIITVAC